MSDSPAGLASPPSERIKQLRATASKIQSLEQQLSALGQADNTRSSDEQHAEVLRINEELCSLREHLSTIHRRVSPVRKAASPDRTILSPAPAVSPQPLANADRDELIALRAEKQQWLNERQELLDLNAEKQQWLGEKQQLLTRIEQLEAAPALVAPKPVENVNTEQTAPEKVTPPMEVAKEPPAEEQHPESTAEDAEPVALPVVPRDEISKAEAAVGRPISAQDMVEAVFSEGNQAGVSCHSLSPKLHGMVQTLFEALDRNSNGVIDLSELEAVHSDRTADLFRYIDANDDTEISSDEFKLFFARLEYSKGSKTVELLLEYLRVNAAAAAAGEHLVVLPICALLIDSFQLKKPNAMLSVAEALSEAQLDRCIKLFSHVDVLDEGAVTKEALEAVWGGASIGLFDSLELDRSGQVTAVQWRGYFEALLNREGQQVLEYTLRNLERIAEAQGALMLILSGERRKPAAEGTLREPSTEEHLASVFDKHPKHKFEPESAALPDQQLTHVREMFSVIDVNQNGVIERSELEAVAGGDSAELFGFVDSNEDGEISADEFENFLSRLEHSKGIKSVALLLEYLRLNARAAAAGEGITVLPICQLLLGSFTTQKPPDMCNPNERLSESQRQRAAALFQSVDLDQDGTISREEIRAVWGGESDGLFDSLDSDRDGSVSPHEWCNYFASMVQAQGHNVTEFALRYFDRAVRVQSLLNENLSEMASRTPELTLPEYEPVARVIAPQGPRPPRGTEQPQPMTPAEQTARAALNPPGAADHAKSVISAATASHPADGIVLSPHTLAIVNDLFASIDTDQDGAIDLQELEVVQGSEAVSLLKHMDANDDTEISLDEFQLFFSHLEHAKGSRTVNLVLEYLRRNAKAAAAGEGFTVLPVADVLLESYDLAKPAAMSSPEEQFTDADMQRLASLYQSITDGGVVTKRMVSQLWGGDSTGIFEGLTADPAGAVSQADWMTFNLMALRDQGRKGFEFMLAYLERSSTAQEVVQLALDSLQGDAGS